MVLDKVRARFPDLVGYILFFGAPLGIVLGTVNRGRAPDQPGEAKFSLPRAVVVGGLAGILGGWAFGQWMAKVNHFPLIAGLIHLSSRNAGVALHFVFAFIIGASFGLLFQRDVRGYGSCLGWGLGYGIFWWFLGPMTLMPLWQGRSLDWSYQHGQELYGSLVGHVVYGLIVGANLRHRRPTLDCSIYRKRSHQSPTGSTWFTHGPIHRLGCTCRADWGVWCSCRS